MFFLHLLILTKTGLTFSADFGRVKDKSDFMMTQKTTSVREMDTFRFSPSPSFVTMGGDDGEKVRRE